MLQHIQGNITRIGLIVLILAVTSISAYKRFKKIEGIIGLFLHIRMDEVKIHSKYYQALDNYYRDTGFDDIAACTAIADEYKPSETKKSTRHR